jgi:hypothetical protein
MNNLTDRLETIQEEIKKIKFIAEELADIPFGSIDQSSRKRMHALARTAAAAFVTLEIGLNYDQAKFYFKRHRTSFYHYNKKHLSYMENPKIYPEYYEFYTKLRELYLNNDENIFKSKRTYDFYQEIEKARQQQNAIERRLKKLNEEAKLLGL